MLYVQRHFMSIALLCIMWKKTVFSFCTHSTDFCSSLKQNIYNVKVVVNTQTFNSDSIESSKKMKKLYYSAAYYHLGAVLAGNNPCTIVNRSIKCWLKKFPTSWFLNIVSEQRSLHLYGATSFYLCFLTKKTVFVHVKRHKFSRRMIHVTRPVVVLLLYLFYCLVEWDVPVNTAPRIPR